MPGDFHISRRLQRELRQSTAEIRINTAFSDVIRECAGPRRSGQGTWITAEMIKAYEDLHKGGWAHSIEVWESGELTGGLYGLTIGKAFFGESMFSLRSNASKLALLYLADRLTTGDLKVLDCQVVSSHLSSLGARIVPRVKFLHSLKSACDPVVPFVHWPDAPIACAELLCE
jgi:leucyl/phenylalanyl-tRNA--protein transferase